MSIGPTSDARSVIGTSSRRSYNFRRDGPARARGRRDRGRPGVSGVEGAMGEKPKSAFELAMERLNAEDREAGTKEVSLSPAQKEAIAEARRVASSRLAERE